MFLRPFVGLLLNADFEELENSPRCVWGELVRGTSVLNFAQIFRDCALDASLFPCFTACRFLDGFVGLPTAFGKNPPTPASRLDQEDFGLVGG